MIADVMARVGEPRRIVLPGASLFYGNFSAMAKGVTLLWACWTIAGPLFEDMNYFMSRVTSLTTDHGVEIHTLELPNILKAFLAWCAGTALADTRGLVIHAERLLYAAIRISGWSHAWANLMKYIAEKSPRWPKVLEQIRSLCSFYRNKTWRQFIKKIMAPTGFDTTELDTFSATTAKWRYETIPNCQKELLRLEQPSRSLNMALFSKAQDKAELRAACEAGTDNAFWNYTNCSYNLVFLSCEDMRHWGMICSCPEHVRMRREDRVKHINCMQNSRRLRDAWPELERELARITTQLNDLTPADTGGSEELYVMTQGMLQRKITGIRQRFGYLATLPLAFSQADTQEGCIMVLALVRQRPLEDHDAFTRRTMATLGGDMARCAEGSPATEALRMEVKRINNSPLNESCGEGCRD